MTKPPQPHPLGDPEALLSVAILHGQAALEDAARAALTRLLADGPQAVLDARELWTPEELDPLAEALAGGLATAELLGRAGPHLTLAGRAEKFDETSSGGDALPALAPLEAIDYFRKLSPKLGVDPERDPPLWERRAFTLCVATEETLLARLQKLIARKLETGEVAGAAEEVEALLEEAGVSPLNDGYAELVVRTNLMDAYTTQTTRELQHPDVRPHFPAWLYSNPDDDRSRETHAEKNGRYWPAEAPFALVRGTEAEDVCHCRCVPIPVYKGDWARLEAAGAKLEPWPLAEAG